MFSNFVEAFTMYTIGGMHLVCVLLTNDIYIYMYLFGNKIVSR